MLKHSAQAGCIYGVLRSADRVSLGPLFIQGNFMPQCCINQWDRVVSQSCWKEVVDNQDGGGVTSGVFFPAPYPPWKHIHTHL